MLSMDIAQFTNLLRRHAGLIHKVAYAYCRNATDRDDVIQEIAIQLWRSRDRYDVRFKETTWIYRIAINVAIAEYRAFKWTLLLGIVAWFPMALILFEGAGPCRSGMAGCKHTVRVRVPRHRACAVASVR